MRKEGPKNHFGLNQQAMVKLLLLSQAGVDMVGADGGTAMTFGAKMDLGSWFNFWQTEGVPRTRGMVVGGHLFYMRQQMDMVMW